jgi:hypothetical protein
MAEQEQTRVVPLAAGGTLTIKPTEYGLQLELWFSTQERAAVVSVPLTSDETRKLAHLLNDALGEATAS